ncbi:phosphopantothenate/pantothenate synthetase [Patescibacteria group bacterium]|nr:phosphopantothenate/pantothenate synthetase [Patescibacteria group bacterium]MCL5798335.1 phosphopantothenate/pantothenate synthetase [Patescibacteria group bacterium]
MKLSTPKSHPRFLSLYYRDLLSEGVKRNITSLQGLTAHGRGETFDYLIGERTESFARKAIESSAALLILAKHPILSVNGNTAILIPKEYVELANLLGAHIEVNIFHAGKKREKNIADYLKKYGAKKILLPDSGKIPGIESNRRMINNLGQAKADVIFVPLEDGDRTGALKKMGKKVITVDLNPMSRTAQKADITIVDNIVRVMPILISQVKKMKNESTSYLKKILNGYDNSKILSLSLLHIDTRLKKLASRESSHF